MFPTHSLLELAKLLTENIGAVFGGSLNVLKVIPPFDDESSELRSISKSPLPTFILMLLPPAKLSCLLALNCQTLPEY